jgi:hypothetical protein
MIDQQKSQQQRLHHPNTKWAIPAAACAVAACIWLLVKDANREPAVEPVAPQSVGIKSANWHAQLVRRNRSLQSNRVGTPWPFAAMRNKPEPMPLGSRREAAATLGDGYQQLSLHFDRAQYSTISGNIGIWVVRGNGVTCIFLARKGLAACNTTAETERVGLTLVAGLKKPNAPAFAVPQAFMAIGIMPDEVRAVRVHSVDGGLKTVPIAHNTFAFRTKRPINIRRLIR